MFVLDSLVSLELFTPPKYQVFLFFFKKKKGCPKLLCFIHIPGQWTLTEHLLRVRDCAQEHIPYLTVQGKGRMESFLSFKSKNVCWADCLQATIWFNFWQCDLLLVISVPLCLTKPGLQLSLLVTSLYFMALVFVSKVPSDKVPTFL